jgi:hypothetical protein
MVKYLDLNSVFVSSVLAVTSEISLSFLKFVMAHGVTRRCRLSWLTNSVLVYKPKCGGGVAGSHSMSTCSCERGVQKNFGDLTVYLTYAKLKEPKIYQEMRARILGRKTALLLPRLER